MLTEYRAQLLSYQLSCMPKFCDLIIDAANLLFRNKIPDTFSNLLSCAKAEPCLYFELRVEKRRLRSTIFSSSRRFLTGLSLHAEWQSQSVNEFLRTDKISHCSWLFRCESFMKPWHSAITSSESTSCASSDDSSNFVTSLGYHGLMHWGAI